LFCCIRLLLLTAPFRDENISGKFEPRAQVPHLFYGEIPLPCQEHRNRTLRTKLRNQVTLREILLFNFNDVAIHRIGVLEHAAHFRKIVPPDRLDDAHPRFDFVRQADCQYTPNGQLRAWLA
jgi:hypothetical protein